MPINLRLAVKFTTVSIAKHQLYNETIDKTCLQAVATVTLAFPGDSRSHPPRL